MTIEEKLNSIRETKEAIKTSIQNKGVEIADDEPFNLYPEKIDSIESGADLSEYFTETISSGSARGGAHARIIKKIPAITNSGTSCQYMFYEFKGTEIDLSNFNTTSVTNMSYMFADCNSLINFDVTKLDTTNVTNMKYMFQNCKAITSLDLSSFNTSKVTDMSNMFIGCNNIESLDLSSFNTTNVTTMYYMFSQCNKLEYLDIRNFDFTNVGNTTGMFMNVPTNCLIIVKDDTAKTWVTTNFATLTNVKTIAEYEAQ